MKIAILGIRGLPSTYSGFETFVGELAPRLKNMGHEVTIYCRKSIYNDKPKKYLGMQMVYLPSIENKFFSTLTHSFLAVGHASVHNFDIIFVVNAANGLFGIIPRVFGKKSILNVDGMEWLRPKWNNLGKWFFKTSAKLGTKFYNEIVTDAEEMHRLYAKDFGIDSTYIAYGANIEESKDPSIVNQYGLEADNYYLIASRLVPDNNADIIIKGFLKSNSKRYLAIAGGANYKGNTVEKKFYEHLVSLSNNRVKFLGHISNPQHIIELHCNAFAYIHGHKYGGINPALLKALGCGNLVLANNTPFNREVLDNGNYGVLFEENDESLTQKILLIENNLEIVKRYRSNAKERIRDNFTWEKIVAQYCNLFDQMLKNEKL